MSRWTSAPVTRAKPLIGIVCCNEVAERPIQAVATRFIDPLVRIAGVAVVLVPAVEHGFDAASLACRLDGLLLTGSRSNVAARRYGGLDDDGHLDEQRDGVALALAERMIEAGRPVFGICRGLQELNVLFGGTLAGEVADRHSHPDGARLSYEGMFDHVHDVELASGGTLAEITAARRLSVHSVHRQGIGRLGGDLAIEAVDPADGLIEAFSARPCGGEVLAVQWHPEWNVDRCGGSRAFFERVGSALAARTCPRPEQATASAWSRRVVVGH